MENINLMRKIKGETIFDLWADLWADLWIEEKIPFRKVIIK